MAQIFQRGTFRGVAGLLPRLVVVWSIAEDADSACPFPPVEEICLGAAKEGPVCSLTLPKWPFFVTRGTPGPQYQEK